jgi:hypothetical protein
MRTKKMRDRMIMVRALRWKGETNGAYELMRSRIEGFGGGERKAIEKSLAEDGEEGVTIIAGRESFSVFRGRERSSQPLAERATRKPKTYQEGRVSRYSLCGEGSGADEELCRRQPLETQNRAEFGDSQERCADIY